MTLPGVAVCGEALPEAVGLFVVDKEEVLVPSKFVCVTEEAGLLVSGCPVVSML